MQNIPKPKTETFEELHVGVHREAEAAHKVFTTKIVLPAMTSISLGFYAAVVKPSKIAYIVAGIGVVHMFFNFWITTLTGTWRTTNFKPRADAVDAVRWALNLILFDTAITALLQPSTSTLGMSWTVLLIAASADMYRQAYRTMVVVLGVICAGFLIFLVPQDALSLREQIFAVFALAMTIYVFHRIESYWAEEMHTRIVSQRMEAEADFRIKSLTRDALLGVQSRMISHELANLILIVDLASQKKEYFNFEKIRRAIYFIKRLNKLVLKDLEQSSVEEKEEFESVLGYVQMLVSKEVGLNNLELKIDVTEDAKKFEFVEYSGSLFLILRNLLKNAADATHEAKSAESIHLSAKVEGDYLRIDVSDNGPGMDESFLRNLLGGSASTTKIDGSGIGFKFVIEQCEKNKFRLTGMSQVGVGTTFTIHIPHVDSRNRDGLSTVV